MQHIQPKHQSAIWLATEFLKRTDLSSGDICLFHYPMDFFPSMHPNEMARAFQMIFEGGEELLLRRGDGGVVNSSSHHSQQLQQPYQQQVHRNNNDNADDAREQNNEQQQPHNNNLVGPSIVPPYLSNASQQARNQITRIQFSWYQFTEFPREIMGRTYINLQHLDIRQNATLTCITSLITQLPQLSSLNLSDCPNLCTLAPLAMALAADDPHQDQEGNGDPSEQELLLGNNNNNRRRRTRSRRTLSLRHLWVRGCNLSTMSRNQWADVFDALSESSGPLERLTLSRNRMKYLHGNVGKLKSLTYLFVEDNNDVKDVIARSHSRMTTSSSSSTIVNFSATAAAADMMDNSSGSSSSPHDGYFELPDELGQLSNLRFISFCGNNVATLPRTMGRLHDKCDLYLHRNPNLTYPPRGHRRSVKAMRLFFHQERMALLRGAVLLLPHLKRARWRAIERLYRPGGGGYMICKERFEESVRKTSITLMGD